MIEQARIVGVVVLGFALLSPPSSSSSGGTAQSSLPSREDGPVEKARQAKTRGVKETTVRVFQDEINWTFSDAIRCYSGILATPLAARVTADSEEVRTWYRFRIDQKIYSPSQRCGKPPLLAIPSQLELGEGEIAVPVTGGELTIEGIKVAYFSADSPRFEIGKQYLLFVTIEGQSLALLGMGGSGAFSRESDNTMRPTISRPTSLRNRLTRLHTLDNVRAAVAHERANLRGKAQ
jgi:hypothetical protein